MDFSCTSGPLFDVSFWVALEFSLSFVLDRETLEDAEACDRAVDPRVKLLESTDGTFEIVDRAERATDRMLEVSFSLGAEVGPELAPLLILERIFATDVEETLSTESRG